MVVSKGSRAASGDQFLGGLLFSIRDARGRHLGDRVRPTADTGYTPKDTLQ